MNQNSYKLDDVDYLPFMFGIEKIDSEHRHLISIFNRLSEKADQKESNDFMKIIDELEKYSNYHFANEETLMKKANFDEIDEHVIQHQIFRQKIDDFKTSIRFGSSMLQSEIIDFLLKWLLKHIMECDAKYVPSIKEYLNQ
ncbi:MAG: hemerythrin [Bacteroidota bacterium]|nr:hemerythrin [Bacteroidota bacterium]